MLTATFENIDAGIRVVDEDLNLIAWDSRYESFFNYPPGMLQVGTPVEKLIRYNVNRGELGPGDPEEQVKRRITQMKNSGFYEGERYRRDGRVLKIAGGPMPGAAMSPASPTSPARPMPAPNCVRRWRSSKAG